MNNKHGLHTSLWLLWVVTHTVITLSSLCSHTHIVPWCWYPLQHLHPQQLQTVLDDLKHETNLLRDQINNERSNAQNLEDLLHTNREKEFTSQLSVQEKGAEIQLLKDRVALNDSKMCVHSYPVHTTSIMRPMHASVAAVMWQALSVSFSQSVTDPEHWKSCLALF